MDDNEIIVTEQDKQNYLNHGFKDIEYGTKEYDKRSYYLGQASSMYGFDNLVKEWLKTQNKEQVEK